MRTIIFASFALAMVLFAGKALVAQEGLPRGDYKETCRDMHVDGDRLDARCQTKDGGWHDTSIDYRHCNASIINDNGNLRCGGADSGENYNRDRSSYDHDRDRPAYDNDPDRASRDHDFGWRGLPPGDYQQTCRNMHVDGDRLHASCQKRNGDWRKTSLDFNRCDSPIVNDNGRLKCNR